MKKTNKEENDNMDESRAIVFSKKYSDPIEALNGAQKIQDIYNKRLKYTFEMAVLPESQKNEDDEGMTVYYVLTLQPGAKRDKRMTGPTQLGLGILKKACDKVYMMQLDDISEVQWSKENEEDDV